MPPGAAAVAATAAAHGASGALRRPLAAARRGHGGRAGAGLWVNLRGRGPCGAEENGAAAGEWEPPRN